MPLLPFGEFRPDVSDINGQYTAAVNNVVPRMDGYGPFKDLEAFTEALAARCRGAFIATKSDGSIKIFAGTATKLYVLDNTDLTWSDASQSSGTYSTLNDQERWEFAQFNDKVIAVQQNAAPQVFDVDSDTEFADLSGTPPQAAHIAIINSFVVLSGIINLPQRVQWSALNDITGWTAGTDYSDYQDLPDGGPIQGVVGGELGIIVQQTSIRRMIYQPGSDVVFSIDRLANNVGCIAPHSITYINDRMFWLSRRGFVMATQSGQVQFIGREKVDRTFLADYDSSQLGLVFGASDPANHHVLFTYKSNDMDAVDTAFDKAFVYDWVMDRWSRIDLSGQYLLALSQPGFTLEGLGVIGSIDVTGAADNGSGLVRLTVTDTTGWTTGDIKDIADVGGTTEANGTFTITVVDGTHIDLQGSTFANAYTSGGYVAGSLDALSASLDSYVEATLPALAMANTSNKFGFFTGSNLEATLETSEQTVMDRRMFIRGFYPQTDADDLTGSIGARENLKAAATFSTAIDINDQGFVPSRVSTRSARARITIAAGDEWTFATGVHPEVRREGKR